MEELLDAIIAEEGQTIMGLEFLIETLNLPMKKIDTLFKKALSEYSERRPMKKTTVINKGFFLIKCQDSICLSLQNRT